MRALPFIPLFILLNLRWLQPVPYSPDDQAFELELQGIHHHPLANSLVDLAVGDTVRVFIETRGCYHFARGSIILTREPSGYVASVRFDDLTTPVSGTARRRLTSAEIAELDLTLAILRPGTPRSSCTATTSYQIAWGYAAESLVDFECRLSVREMNNERVPTVSFMSLLWDLGEPLQREWMHHRSITP